MRTVVLTNRINALGKTWEGFTSTISYNLTDEQASEMIDSNQNIIRDNVSFWLDKNAGDFAHIFDFDVDFSFDNGIDIRSSFEQDESQEIFDDLASQD